MKMNKLIFTIALTGFLVPTAIMHAMEAQQKQVRQEQEVQEEATVLLSEAIEKNDVVLAERAVKQRGVNVNKPGRSGYSPLCLASMAGNAAIVDMLLDAKADIDARDAQESNVFFVSPLAAASSYGNVDVVKRLLDGNADMRPPAPVGSVYRVGPLIHAAVSGTNMGAFCLSKGHSSIVHIIKSVPPLDSAYVNIARMLLVNKADVNEEHGVRDEYGPLKMALSAGEGNLAMVTLLILAGAKTDKLDRITSGLDSRGSCWKRATPVMRQAIEDAKEEARTAPERVAIISDYLLNGPLAIESRVDLLFEYDDALFFAAIKMSKREVKKESAIKKLLPISKALSSIWGALL